VGTGGATQDMPVCGARVHICEVDRWPLIIARLPDHEILRLRDDLIDILRHPRLPKTRPPFPFPPGPGPLLARSAAAGWPPGRVQPAARPPVGFTQQARSGPQPQPLPPRDFAGRVPWWASIPSPAARPAAAGADRR
jgi:hypothetical protein